MHPQLALKLERGQFLNLRTALGYRNSTPTNVIAESKTMLLKNRANYLAKNFVIRVLKYGPKPLRKSLDKLARAEKYSIYRNSLNRTSTLSNA